MNKFFIIIAMSLSMMACYTPSPTTQSAKVSASVERQQSQYAKSQPVPAFKWSLERDILIQLYNIRNMKALTHSVWRSDYGLIEGDCASIGFGMPYDTSLTNPLVATHTAMDGDKDRSMGRSLTSIEQPEPNGVFASKNTAATWVMCAGSTGNIEPVYVETRVTAYPYSVKVDYANNRVTKAGKATVTITR